MMEKIPYKATMLSRNPYQRVVRASWLDSAATFGRAEILP
jgi:hypothetical protein